MKFTSALVGGMMFSVAASTSTTTTLEQFKADLKAKSVGMDGFIFDDYCATICFFTSSCRNDPHAHGSYCKTDHFPNVCFGLYRRPSFFPRFCFQPNDPSCPVWYTPGNFIFNLRKSFRFFAVVDLQMQPHSRQQHLQKSLVYLNPCQLSKNLPKLNHSPKWV